MASWDSGRKFGFGITALLLLASCSTPPSEGTDSNRESVEHDAVVETSDTNEVEDVTDAVDIRADSFEGKTDTDDAIADGVADVGDVIGDVRSDVLACGDVPQEGCPCDSSTDEPCCLMVAKGLSCDNDRLVNGVLIYAWGVFSDCGCIDGPECEGYEIYPLCPWESRKKYY